MPEINGQSPTGEYHLGEYYTGEYYDGESLVVQFVVGELYGPSAVHFIAGQFEEDDSFGLFLMMKQTEPIG